MSCRVRAGVEGPTAVGFGIGLDLSVTEDLSFPALYLVVLN